MKEKNQKELLLTKLTDEYRKFKTDTLFLSKEDIYANAYKIDIIINMYEILVDLADKMKASELEKLLERKEILESFYNEWLNVEDDFYEQIGHFMIGLVKNGKKVYKIS